MAKKKTSTVELDASDYEPLLVAISSRAVDTCLMGAQCLALLEDPRAFGLLMQLSREDDGNVRLETCRSFEQLGDRRAIDRLCSMLVDIDAKVRDAAYTALETLANDQPLVAAEHGLAADFEDVRRRGLETLVRFAKKTKLTKIDEPAGNLLKQALSDSVVSVRMEAFKFTLNSKIGGGEDATLRFLLTSVHADVRREVLNEVMAEDIQLWSETMMFELLSDPDQGIRGDAFEFLQKKYDQQQTGWLAEAIRSSYVDIRKKACERLVKIGNATAQATLALAINDSEPEIRQLALQSLISKGATDSLVTALESKYTGIRLAAANALAQVGDERCKSILLEIAGQDYPETEPEQKLWEESVCQAIDGLLMLGDSETVSFLVERCGDQNANVRQHAAEALNGTADFDSLDLISPLLRHEDPNVRLPAAMASAIHGDMVSARVVLSPDADGPIDDEDRLLTAVALGEKTETKLVQMLDVKSVSLANSALIVLLCRDWLSHDGTPRRILAALAARDARIRLLAAAALQAFSDEEKLAAVIANVFNDRATNEDWEVDSGVIRSIAEVLVFSKSHVQCRAVLLLERLAEDKQEKWDFGWRWFCDRFETELEAASQSSRNSKVAKTTTSEATLDQLAFGTYVGLSRGQGGFHFRKYTPRFGWSVENIRLSALRRLGQLANKTDAFLEPTLSVLTHACSGPWASVREMAFEQLKGLGVEDDRLAEIAISSSQLDLAVVGLGLLTKSAKAAKRKEVLTEAILNQPRMIALQAAQMLREDMGSVKACEVCLDSSNVLVKKSAVTWVAEDYEEVAAAKKSLRQLALDSAPEIRRLAIDLLVGKRDEKAFEAVTSLFDETDPKLEKVCYKWLLQLRDERTPAFLLELLDQKAKELSVAALLAAVSEFRDAESVPPLLELLAKKEFVADVVKAVTKISGFDQRIHDPNDRTPLDRRWLDAQHPRLGNVLAELMDRTIELGLADWAKSLIPAARWCLTEEVNLSLERLCASPDETTRRHALEAVSFRAEKRDASVEVLKSAVSHRDPMSQFIAAEGLAKNGHDEGMSVLMSAVEMMDDLRFRRRAVLAIGKLADERGLDLLLKLVTHDAHALQDSAAEAIGYLGQSSQKEKIFGLLKKLVAQEGTAGTRAIVGLRHMDTPEAWNVIRSKAKTTSHSLSRAVVIEQLGYDASPTTQDLLVDLLERFPNDLSIQLAAARRSFGNDSIVPDLALLRGRSGNRGRLGEVELLSLERVCELGTPEQILELVSRCPAQARDQLSNSLLLLDGLPTKEAAAALDSQYAASVELAARVLGSSGDKKNAKRIGAILLQWSEEFIAESHRRLRQNEAMSPKFGRQRAAVEALAWAAGRVGGSEKALLHLVTNHVSNDHFANLRATALEGLMDCKVTSTMESELMGLLEDYDPKIRKMATDLLLSGAKAKPERVGQAILVDRFAFANLARDEKIELAPLLESAAKSAHYQPRVLRRMTQSEDSRTLLLVAEDPSQDVNSRLGAIEGLAKMGGKKAEEALVSLGQSANLVELKKAAWRGLRRSKRAGAK